MIDKKEMKLIDFKIAQRFMYESEQVFMVHMDGTLVEMTELTDWKVLISHYINGGSYAVYRKRFVDEFYKEVRISNKVFAVNHTKKGGNSEWKFASYRDNQ